MNCVLKVSGLAILTVAATLLVGTDDARAQREAPDSFKVNGCPLCQGHFSDGADFSQLTVHETGYWKVVVYPSDQANLGRCVVVLKRHCPSLSQLREAEWVDFAAVTVTMEAAVRKAFGATLFNWSCLMNTVFRPEYRDKNIGPHVHWHLRPRYAASVTFAGVVFDDPEFGRHYDRNRRHTVAPPVVAEIVSRIRSSKEQSSGR